MITKFITPCPVHSDGTAHACGPIEWGPGEKRATFEVFLVQEDGYARGMLKPVNKGTEIWELEVEPVHGRLTPGYAVGLAIARVVMESKEEGEVIATVPWSEPLTLVEETK